MAKSGSSCTPRDVVRAYQEHKTIAAAAVVLGMPTKQCSQILRRAGVKPRCGHPRKWTVGQIREVFQDCTTDEEAARQLGVCTTRAGQLRRTCNIPSGRIRKQQKAKKRVAKIAEDAYGAGGLREVLSDLYRDVEGFCTRHGIRTRRAWPKPKSRSYQILKFLADNGPSPHGALRAHTAPRRTSVGNWLCRLRDAGLVEQGEPLPGHSRGRYWQVTETGREHVR